MEMVKKLELIFVVLFGLCIGSFLNVCIYRIAREESISFPPSHCTSCGYELKAKDLVPVLSYTFLGGRCRSCKEKISIKYPMVEILNTLIYVIIYLNYGLSIELIEFAIFSSLMIVIGVDGTILVGLKTYPRRNEAIRIGSMIKQNLKFIFIISI